MMNELVLKAEAVGKCYGTFRALEGIDMELTPGIYGLLGPNGAGKSTMMNILSGLIEPSEGQVLFNGKEIGKLGKEYRAVLGIVPQQQWMYEFFTGYEFLAYMAALKGIPNAIARERIGQLLERVELSGAAGKKLGAYSGGMKQRLLLAQALLNDPAVLLLDEPTAGLDPRGRELILGQIKEYHQAAGNTVLLVSHSMEDIANYAGKALVMNSGKLYLYDEVAAVFSHQQELTGMGLSVPQVARIFTLLAQKGYPVNPNVFRVEDAVLQLKTLLEKGVGTNA